MELVINVSVTRSLYSATVFTEVMDIVPVILQHQTSAWITQNEKKPK
jgi:hypothetical protein